MPKRHINLTYAAVATTTAPFQEQSASKSIRSPDPSITPNVTHGAIFITLNDNSSRIAELETSIQSIHSKSISMQSDHQGLRADFQKVVYGVLQHSKEILALQSDIHSISSIIQEICNAVLPNASSIFFDPLLHPCASPMTSLFAIMHKGQS
jgi:hypothetical protein